MKIAVLSGKGGTGKTFMSVNLAAVSQKAVYLDCDVEEPNGHLFFKPQDLTIQNVSLKVPEVDFNKCSGCRKCIDFCRFNALAYINGKIKIFDGICHSCGGCTVLCPEKAMYEREKIIGKIEEGMSQNVKVITGILNTGEASGVPIIKKLLDTVSDEADITIIDCPPGSACVVMESIKDADFCLLVAESTIFGAHNLNIVYKLVKFFKKSFGVILNKCTGEDNPSEVFCRENNVPILAKIPFDSELGYLNSNASIAARERPKYNVLFSEILTKICMEV